MVDFTEIVATAIANAESRAELAASRARVVTAADETRRRLQRDLHDGAQQRIVSLALRLRTAAMVIPPEMREVHEELAGVGSELAEVLTNVAKHASASVVQVEVDADDGLVRLAIQDDGVGGADPTRGSGLIGLKDRVEATGGTLHMESRPGEGPSLVVELPVDAGQLRDGT